MLGIHKSTHGVTRRVWPEPNLPRFIISISRVIYCLYRHLVASMRSDFKDFGHQVAATAINGIEMCVVLQYNKITADHFSEFDFKLRAECWRKISALSPINNFFSNVGNFSPF